MSAMTCSRAAVSGSCQLYQPGRVPCREYGLLGLVVAGQEVGDAGVSKKGEPRHNLAPVAPLSHSVHLSVIPLVASTPLVPLASPLAMADFSTPDLSEAYIVTLNNRGAGQRTMSRRAEGGMTEQHTTGTGRILIVRTKADREALAGESNHVPAPPASAPPSAPLPAAAISRAIESLWNLPPAHLQLADRWKPQGTLSPAQQLLCTEITAALRKLFAPAAAAPSSFTQLRKTAEIVRLMTNHSCGTVSWHIAASPAPSEARTRRCLWPCPHRQHCSRLPCPPDTARFCGLVVTGESETNAALLPRRHRCACTFSCTAPARIAATTCQPLALSCFVANTASNCKHSIGSCSHGDSITDDGGAAIGCDGA